MGTATNGWRARAWTSRAKRPASHGVWRARPTLRCAPAGWRPQPPLPLVRARAPPLPCCVSRPSRRRRRGRHRRRSSVSRPQRGQPPRAPWSPLLHGPHCASTGEGLKHGTHWPRRPPGYPVCPAQVKLTAAGEGVKSVASRASGVAAGNPHMVCGRALPPPPPPLSQRQRPPPPPPPPRPRSPNMAALLSEAVAAAAGWTALSPPQRSAEERARRALGAVDATNGGGGGDGAAGDGDGKDQRGNRGGAGDETGRKAAPAMGGVLPGRRRGREAAAASGWVTTTGASHGGGGGSGGDARAAFHAGVNMAVATSARATHEPGTRGPPQATSRAPMPSSSGEQLVTATGGQGVQPGWPTGRKYEVPPPPRRQHPDIPNISRSSSNSGGTAQYDVLAGGFLDMTTAGLPVLGRPPPPLPCPNHSTLQRRSRRPPVPSTSASPE